MAKEITLEEARSVIKEWGIDSDNYSCVNLKQYMHGGDASDNSIQTHGYHQKCLQIVVDAGLSEPKEAKADAIHNTEQLEIAHNQCHECFLSWHYRGKQDQGWCYTHRNYKPDCEEKRYE